MDWRNGEAEADWNYDVLWRIAAMLFALAGLADRAAGVSVWRRRRVLGIVMDGEAEARSLVIGMATGMAEMDDDSDREPEPVPDAVYLAMRLRGLGLVLCVLLAGLPGRIGAACQRAVSCKHARRAGVRARVGQPAPDTS